MEGIFETGSYVCLKSDSNRQYKINSEITDLGEYFCKSITPGQKDRLISQDELKQITIFDIPYRVGGGFYDEFDFDPDSYTNSIY